MLRWGTGFDFMQTSTAAQAALSRLYWYDFADGPAPLQPKISANGRFAGSKALVVPNGVNSGSRIAKLINGAPFAEFYYGVAVYVYSDGLTTNLPMFGAYYSGERRLQVEFGNYGKVSLYANGTDLLATSEAMSYATDSWLFLEIGGLLSGSTSGWATVKINTKPVIEMINTVTVPSGDALTDSIQIKMGDSGGAGFLKDAALWDDIYTCDASGSVNNTFLGNTRTQALLPAGAGANTDFTPYPSPPNWDAADNIDVDDSSYVYSATATDYDLYTVTPLVNAPDIFGVLVLGAYRQDDATQRSVKNLLYSNGTTVEGEEYFTNTTYAFTQPDIYETDPDTAVTWLYSAVNLIQIGPKVES